MAAQEKRIERDWSLGLLVIAGWLCVAAFGGLFWMVNGSFSVQGLGIIAKAMGNGGMLFWHSVSAWRTSFGLDLPGLPGEQPVIPWLGVISASLFQVGLIVRATERRPIPVWAWVLGGLISVYDYGTTFAGIGVLAWVARAGMVLQVPLAALMTFGLEALIGYLLRKRK